MITHANYKKLLPGFLKIIKSNSVLSGLYGAFCIDHYDTTNMILRDIPGITDLVEKLSKDQIREQEQIACIENHFGSLHLFFAEVNKWIFLYKSQNLSYTVNPALHDNVGLPDGFGDYQFEDSVIQKMTRENGSITVQLSNVVFYQNENVRSGCVLLHFSEIAHMDQSCLFDQSNTVCDFGIAKFENTNKVLFTTETGYMKFTCAEYTREVI